MAKTNLERQKEFQARKKIHKAQLQDAIDTLDPELAADCKMRIAPPGPNDNRPRINWDIGAPTHALMDAHAKSYAVTLDELLYEIGFQYCMKRPDIYWAMKSAKINISAN